MKADDIFHQISKAFNLSKEPNHTKEAYISALKLYNEGKLNEQYHITLAWIAYRYLKENYKSIGSKEARKVLALYTKLQTTRPSLLHSVFLYLAINIKKTYSDFLFTSFLKIWGFGNFRIEDWAPSVYEGQSYPSCVQKVINIYWDECKSMPNITIPEEFVSLLEEATRKYPRDFNIKRYLAIALTRQGKKDEAIELYRELLINDNRYYIWHELGKLLNDTALRKSALCMALKQQKKEDFLGAIHLELAEILIEEKVHGQALVDLNKYEQTYNANKWPLSATYYRLRNLIPQNTNPGTRSRQWLEEETKTIQTFVFMKLPNKIFLLTEMFKNKDGKTRYKLVCYDKSSIIVKPAQIPDTDAMPGCFYRVFYDNTNKWIQPVRIEKAEKEALNEEWNKTIKTVRGNITVKSKPDGKQFGFVHKCYVGGHLLKDIKNGTKVEVLAWNESNRSHALTLTIV